MRFETLTYRIRDLAADRSRSLLVVLGVVWGTLSLTVVVAFGSELQRAMGRAVRSGGIDYVRFWSGSTTRPHAGLPAGRWIGLVSEDAARIAAAVPDVRSVSVEFINASQPVEYHGRSVIAGVHGVNPAYAELRQMVPAPGGRFLNARDERERRRVVFLGNAVKERLFGRAPALGKVVRIWGSPFTVVGVLRPKWALGNYEFMDRDKVFVPAETFRALKGWRYPSYLVIGLRSAAADAQVIAQIYRLLGKDRGFDPADEAALGVYNQSASDRITWGIVVGIRILLGLVGLLGLLVALVGVTNVLYVMVEERRHEIGVQMALGAKPQCLLTAYLLDGFLLTLSGGAVGILLSWGVLSAFNRIPLGSEARSLLGAPHVSLAVALAVTTVLAVAGAVAAYFPSRRAAAADPVESLREE